MKESRRLDENLSEEFLRLIQQTGLGRIQRFSKGRMLFWQSDPVDAIYVVRTGAVKVFSVSPEGKTYAFDILGAGGMLGLSDFLLGKPYEVMAETVEDSEVITISPPDFENQLSTNPRLSAIVMRLLAAGNRFMVSRIKDLGFLDVQHRLKQRLVELAEEHGIVTPQGIRIDLDITHEEIGELIAANRVTITAYLNEFKRQGYLWKDGRYLVIIPPDHMEVLDQLNQAVIDGDEDGVIYWAKRAIANRVDPLKAFEALTSGMRQVDRMLVRNEIEVADVILSAYVMKSGLAVLQEALEETEPRPGNLGTIVIGTVHGDIHDIGRTMVAMLLTARGFNIIDLGINVSIEQFVAAVREYHPDILAMSSLMTTTAPEQKAVIDALKAEGLDAEIMVLVGGGAITKKFSAEIGANGFAPDGQRAVELAYRMVRQRQGAKDDPGRH